MAEYNKLGIAIRYAAFPRSGINTPSFFKAENVWCAKDQQKAMNFAKNGAKLDQLKQVEKVKGKQCGDQIKKHYQVAREVGVTGTPTLVMQDGQVLPGYVPAARLNGILNQK
jgi:thiol:disulfide interchange protein DsbC